MKKFIWTILVLMTCIPKVNALCDYKLRANEKELASNVAFDYEYIEGQEVTFNVTVSNLFGGLILQDPNGKTYQNQEEIVIKGFKEGTTLLFTLLSPTDECSTNILYTKYITLPSYNPFYNDPVCEGIDFSLCNKWVKVTYSHSKFVEEVNKYKHQEGLDEKKEEESKESFFSMLIRIFTKYYYYTIGIAVLIIVLIVLRIIRYRTKF